MRTIVSIEVRVCNLLSQAGSSRNEARWKKFDVGSWHSMLRVKSIEPYGQCKPDGCMAVLLNHAARLSGRKFDIAVMVTSNAAPGTGQMAISDPSGSVNCSFAECVTGVYSDMLRKGCVLLLKEVFVVAYFERRKSGYYMDIDSHLMMTIRLQHIECIFPATLPKRPDDKELMNSYSDMAQGLEDYRVFMLRNRDVSDKFDFSKSKSK